VSSTFDIWRLANIGDEWHLSETGSRRLRKDKSVDTLKMDGALRMLTENIFRVEEFLPERKDQLEVLELAVHNSRMQISFEFPSASGSPRFRNLKLGAKRAYSPGQEFYALLNHIDVPVLISRDTAKRLMDLVDHLDEVTEAR
jgi:hypothetical protein